MTRELKNWTVNLSTALILFGSTQSAFAVNVDFTTDPGWTGSNNGANGNNFGWDNVAPNEAGGLTGEAGGFFARTTTDSFYGDTNLSSTFTLNTAFSASGKFDFLDITSASGGWGDNDGGLRGAMYIGHFSEAAGIQDFMGLELLGNDSQTSVAVRGVYGNFGGGNADVTVGNFNVNGNYTFSYSYDPTIGNGQLSVSINGGAPALLNLTAGQRSNVAVFDAFGMGIVPGQIGGAADSTDTVRVFIDDVTYTGFQATPEPSGCALVAFGLMSLAAWKRRGRRLD